MHSSNRLFYFYRASKHAWEKEGGSWSLSPHHVEHVARHLSRCYIHLFNFWRQEIPP